MANSSDIKKIALETLALESNSIKNLSKVIDDNFINIVETLFKSTGKIILTGIGKSAIIGMKISATLNSTGTKSSFLHLGDALHGDMGVIDKDDIKKGKSKTKDEKSEIRAKEKFILSITENGYGKRTSHYDFRVTNRGGKGIIGIVNSPRNGNVSSSFPVFEGDQILISTNKGRVIRTAVKEIRIAGRNTQGVRIIKLTGDEKVVSSIKLDDNLV